MDPAELIGAALQTAADGTGHRPIAAALGLPAATVTTHGVSGRGVDVALDVVCSGTAVYPVISEAAVEEVAARQSADAVVATQAIDDVSPAEPTITSSRAVPVIVPEPVIVAFSPKHSGAGAACAGTATASRTPMLATATSQCRDALVVAVRTR